MSVLATHRRTETSIPGLIPCQSMLDWVKLSADLIMLHIVYQNKVDLKQDCSPMHRTSKEATN